MVAALDQIAGLVDDAGFAKLHQVLRLVECDFLFKLIAAQATILRGAFNSKVPARVADSHPDSTPATAADIPLLDAAAVVSLPLEAVAPDKELAFYLQSAHQLTIKTE